ncbi:MAG: FAD-dependent oxidoreductase [Verrucomicrobia bacterium]|nr:FAD-dependent oxidoreductase [Verrucomicrobiota bacterium]
MVGGVGLTAAVAPGYCFGGPGRVSPGVLLEAASFAKRGGWVLDTQHYQQMGGCYLLAHGLGRPVAPAKSQISLPEAGRWHMWVRTRNWCPGNWEAPGRFKVRVNGVELATAFGTAPGWAWQPGGPIEAPAAGEVSVELLDLTGFDGRCDALFFSREPAPQLPNEDLVELAAWKDRLAGRQGLPIETRAFDVVIVGGGIAGCAAALTARSQGLEVALIQDRPIFGGNASEEVRVHTIGIPGKGSKLLSTIDTEHYPNGDALAKEDQKKREATMAASGVQLFPLHLCCGLEKVGDRIASVEAREATSGLLRRFRAPIFIDCTGDGWLGYWGGAQCRYGREARTEFGEAWDLHGDLWSPAEADGRVMGASVLWNSERTGEGSSFPEVPWARPVAKEHAAINGEWYWEYSANDLDQIRDAERIRDHLLRAIYGSFANAKRNPNHASVALKWVAYVAGKRESRRIMGDYLYTMRDMMERRRFPDAVVEETREIDAHHQLAETGSPVDFLSKAMFYKTGGMYYVPFRCLYSRDVANLMMAGRCFSCSHIGLCGPRVMKTCGQMGIATGYAAALCKKHRATPRQIGQQHIVELRQLIGYGPSQS